MEAFPAFFPLSGRRVIIAGDGEGAEAKARMFEGSPAEIVHLTGVAASDPARYAGACLAFVASADAKFREAAAAAARAAGVPLNVVDHPALSDFYTPAVVDRGQVVAAVGTAGAAPILAAMLRADLEARIPEGAGRVAALMRLHQDEVRAALPHLPARRAFLRALMAGPAAEAASAGDMARASQLLRAALAGGENALGRVSLIEGAGDLTPLAALTALAAADVVVAEPQAEGFVRAHCRRDAERLAPEDATSGRLGELAAAGRRVVAAVADGAALAGALTAAGVKVELYRPAPAPKR